MYFSMEGSLGRNRMKKSSSSLPVKIMIQNENYTCFVAGSLW
jgi:hypothetical protein